MCAAAAGKGQAVFSSFERREAGLERSPGGVAGARVLVPLVLAGFGLHESRAVEYGGHDGAGRGIRRLSPMDGESGESIGWVVQF